MFSLFFSCFAFAAFSTVHAFPANIQFNNHVLQARSPSPQDNDDVVYVTQVVATITTTIDDNQILTSTNEPLSTGFTIALDAATSDTDQYSTASGNAWTTWTETEYATSSGTGFPSQHLTKWTTRRQKSSHSAGTTTSAASSTSTTASAPASSSTISASASISATTSASASVSASASTTAYSSSSVSSSTSTSAAAVSLPSPLRGVNIGNWLVLEEWMNSTVFDGTDASDQWSFDSTDGAQEKLEAHWSTYFTESDVEQFAAWGINAIRIPIGFWAYDNADTPYLTGADTYLEQAIGWCRTHGIKVLVDCHGSPGSQNGFDNSGHAGNVEWQSGDNLDRSISVLETIATKYGATEYADVVFGIEMVNEPISWDNNNFDTTKQWAQDAYNAIKGVATNPNLIVVMHDGFMGPSEWEDVGSSINGDASLEEAKFWIDTHLYQNQAAADSLLTQAEHITKACGWSSSDLLPSSSQLPVIVGEFSAATNICANPDGSTVAGTVCYIDGCQCANNVGIEDWNQPLLDATRQFFEAEVQTFESHSRGWFMWSFKGYGGWSWEVGVQYGFIGKTAGDVMFPNQCSS